MQCWHFYFVEFACRGVSSNDFPCLEGLCKKIIKEKQPFERLEIRKETLLEMFKVFHKRNISRANPRYFVRDRDRCEKLTSA